MPRFATPKKRTKKKPKRPEVKRPCRFTKDEIFEIDYRELDVLRRYLSSQGKIQPLKKNSIASCYQRQLGTAIKRARYLALLPYVGD